MDGEELADWIETLDTYFDLNDVEEDKETKLKDFFIIWWNSTHNERKMNGKKPITKTNEMIAMMKSKFMPIDFEVQMIWKFHNHKKWDQDVATHIEEFERLNMQTHCNEDQKELVARYVNGLKYKI